MKQKRTAVVTIITTADANDQMHTLNVQATKVVKTALHTQGNLQLNFLDLEPSARFLQSLSYDLLIIEELNLAVGSSLGSHGLPTWQSVAWSVVLSLVIFGVNRYVYFTPITGPFPEGPGKVKFLIVAIDYFTKWIEAKPVATITGNQIKKFVWDNIVCRFGLPGEIISNNRKQFQDNPFKDWCKKLCIRQHFASVKHPQTNGLVERANRSLGEGIKARLDERSKNWMEELPHVLWARRTMIKSSNRDTPFSLTYGTKAVIPAEIGMPTLRIVDVDLVQNDEALEINLDLLEERREQATIREAKSKAKMERYYNSKVRSISFKPGDLVYRNNDASHAEDTGKLRPKWEGPYEVTEALGKGA
ncbi:reverse transcriptase domain-containing protein [Tanacetum coccineum]